jgi:HRAS-like suppressor 3
MNAIRRRLLSCGWGLGHADDAGEGRELRSSLGAHQEPPLGAHLTTTRRGYWHHGVYVGKGRVVHYSGLSGGLWQCGPVEEVSRAKFARGHAVWIVEHAKSQYSSDEIARRARSRIGENNYRLLTNNCEHFCNWCRSGVSHSAQVQRPLQLPFRALGTLFNA